LDRAQEKYRLLVVDDKANMRQFLAAALGEQRFSVHLAASGEEAIALLRQEPFQIVISDFSMPGKGGLEVLKAAKTANSDCEVIIITGYGTIETAVEAMRLGAHDYITKPLRLDELEGKVARILRKLEAVDAQHAEGWMPPPVGRLVGGSAATRSLIKMIKRVAPSYSSVLITGPSGVGKELVARAIHEASPRHDKPFIAVNCAALATSVLESELFGHEKGAFTGAAERRLGRFERAHTGTLFLDEVGEMAPAIQAKLLRVLQEAEIERVGGHETVPVDVRILAATNRDLYTAMQAGEFREDFYYRLNVIALNVPPLRERPEDIHALVEHFLHKYCQQLGKPRYEVEEEVMDKLLHHPWPGNVRELENVIERAVVLAEGDRITPNELPPEFFPSEPESEQAPEPDTLPERTDRMESEQIRHALDKFRWNKTKTAESLGLKRTTLQYKIKKYGLE